MTVLMLFTSSGLLIALLDKLSPHAAAQCAHAAVGVVEVLKKQNQILLRQWDEYGSAKIALKCPSEEELVSASRVCSV